MNVTTVTSNAAIAEAADTTDYAEMLEELIKPEGAYTTRQIAELAGNQVTHTAWSKWKANPDTLTRKGKQLLREMLKLQKLPPTPTEAVADMDENATVYRTGTQPPDSLHVWNSQESQNNGQNALMGIEVPEGHVNTVTAPCNQVTQGARSKRVRTYARIADMPVKMLANSIRNRAEYG